MPEGFHATRCADGDVGVVPNDAPISPGGEVLSVASRRDFIDHDSLCRKCFPPCQTP